MHKELFLALEAGHLPNIQRLHVQNSQVLLELTFKGDTALHIAAREGHLNIVEWILQMKPSLAGVRNKDLNFPLFEAAKNGNTDVVRILLQHRKSSVYRSNKFGETALIIACKYGYVETVALLWEAKKYKSTWEIERSLTAAAYGRYPDVTNVILGNPIKSQPFRLLLLLLHEWDTYEEVGKIMLRYLLFFFSKSEKSVATLNLHAAILGGNREIVEAMLNSSAWKDGLMTKEDNCGRCPIHVAAIKGSWDIFNEFMSRWPESVEIRNSDDKSVLHFAVEYNQIQIVQNLLLNKSHQRVGELVSRDHDCFHNTALHFAAKNGVDPQLVEYLISFPAVDVNAVNDQGMTALDIASEGDRDNPNSAIIKRKLEDARGFRLHIMPKSNTASDSKQGEDKDIVNTQIVVASLIATVTFAAMFQIPGGIEDDKNSIHYGAAKLAFHNLFRLFIFSDIAAFTSSITVVVTWLFRQLLGDTISGITLALSEGLVVMLIVSIFWTAATLVSATIIVTVPSKYQNLKSTHNKAFSTYEALWERELLLAIVSASYAGMPLLALGYALFRGRRINFKYFKHVIYLPVSAVTICILLLTFVR